MTSINQSTSLINDDVTSKPVGTSEAVRPFEARERIGASEVDAEVGRRDVRVDPRRRLRPKPTVKVWRNPPTWNFSGMIRRVVWRWRATPLLPALAEKSAAAAGAAAGAAAISRPSSVPELSAPVLSGRSGVGRNGLDGRRGPAGVWQTVGPAEASDAAALVVRHRRVELARPVGADVRRRREKVEA